MNKEKLIKNIDKAICRAITSPIRRKYLNNRIIELVDMYLESIEKESKPNIRLVSSDHEYPEVHPLDQMCPECDVGVLESLSTTFGDLEGIRHDRKCNYCNTYFGMTKARMFKFHEYPRR